MTRKADDLGDRTGGPVEPGTTLGDFWVVALIGQGAQGRVFEARQTSLDRAVALKVLPHELVTDAERIERFRREAEAGARPNHRAIVAIHAVGEDRGIHYIAQELVRGGRTLGDAIDEVRRMPEPPPGYYRETAGLFAEIAEGLDAAHAQGIVHRDVKPSNILITPDGQPKVADFGLAKMRDAAGISLSGEVAGTPFYMSPEAAAASRGGLDHRADVFSLGSTLYEALTLVRPFQGDTREHILEQIVLYEPVEPRALRRHLPRDLAVICVKALEKRPERRFQTAGEMAADLRRYLAHEPIRARPPGPFARLGKWRRRHPVEATAAVALIVVFGLISLLLESRVGKERAERQLAQVETEVERLRSDVRQSAEQTELLAAIPGLRGSFGDLLTSLTQTVASARERGEALAARDALQAVARPAELAERPDERWRRLIAVGVVSRDQGWLGDAVGCFTDALEIARRSFDPGDDRRATAALELAKVYRVKGQWDLAEQQLAPLRISSAAEPAVAREAGLLFMQTGRIEEAETWLRRAYDERIAASAGDIADTDTLLAVWSLGTFLLEQRRDMEAQPLLLEAREAARRLYPELHRDVLALELAIGRLRMRQANDFAAYGMEDEAAELREQAREHLVTALDGQRIVLPTGHIDTLNTESSLALLEGELGRTDEALRRIREVVEVATETRGARDPRTLFFRNNEATVLHGAGRTEQAEGAWREVVAWDVGIPVGGSEGERFAMENLAALLFGRGDFEEAAALSRLLVELTPQPHFMYEERVRRLAAIEDALAASSND